MDRHDEILNKIYDDAMIKVSKNDLTVSGIKKEDIDNLNLIVERSESNKGMVAVLTTLLTHKIFNPKQDISRHSWNMDLLDEVLTRIILHRL